MKISILSLTCMGFIVSIEAMLNPEAPLPAPPGLPVEHYKHIDLGCTFHAQIKGNKYVERGLLRNKGEGYPPWVRTHTHMEQDYMAEGLSVYLDVQDITPPGPYAKPTKWFKADLMSFPRTKPIGETRYRLECPAHTYRIQTYETAISYRNNPSRVYIRPLVGNEDKKYIKVYGYIVV